jgi:hypothetical protein
MTHLVSFGLIVIVATHPKPPKKHELKKMYLGSKQCTWHHLDPFLSVLAFFFPTQPVDRKSEPKYITLYH